MKTACKTLSGLAVLLVAAAGVKAEDWTTGMKTGNPEFRAMGPVAFGPDGILFIADAKSAAITAVATGDTSPAEEDKPVRVEAVDRKLAGLLGSSVDQILIEDLAVNPLSRNVYMAVSRGRGPDAVPVLVRVTGGKLEVVDLKQVKYARAELPDAPMDGVVGEGRRRSNPRQESITDVGFFQARVLVAGLSNEEFASTFRAIPYPFKTVENGTSVEIYHGAHGRFETRAPIRTFVPFQIGNEPHLLAAYTCTPLVQLPVKALEPGGKVRGKTIAELGNRNRPLDMIVYEKDGASYLLLANSSRGVMKIRTNTIAEAEGIESKVADTDGLPYETIEEWRGVAQLDRFDRGNAIVVRRGSDERLDLESLQLP